MTNPLAFCAGADVRLVHDAADLYIRFADGQPVDGEAGLLVDVCPAGKGPVWRVEAREGNVTCTPPEGYPVAPLCRVRTEDDARGPRMLVSIPFCEFVQPGDLGGTPLADDTWRLSVRRVGSGGNEDVELHEIRFLGGPTQRRIEMLEFGDPFFGVSLVKFEVETVKPKGVSANLWPSPSEFLRTKNPAHVKFRVAKPGSYRLHLRTSKEPDEFEDEEAIAGEASYAAGTVFSLPPIWDDLLAMERDIDVFREATEEKNSEWPEDLSNDIEFLQEMILSSDNYRLPGCREKMDPAYMELIKGQYAEVRAGLESFLPDVAAANPRAVQASVLNVEALFTTGAGAEDESGDTDSALTAP
jgi:hypothetical protein